MQPARRSRLRGARQPRLSAQRRLPAGAAELPDFGSPADAAMSKSREAQIVILTNVPEIAGEARRRNGAARAQNVVVSPSVAEAAAFSPSRSITMDATMLDLDRMDARGWKQIARETDGLFFCKDCDGFRVQGKRVIVAGNNNEAVEYALAILTYTHCVTLVTNGQKPRWSQQHENWLREYEVPVELQRRGTPMAVLSNKPHDFTRACIARGVAIPTSRKRP